MHLSVPFDSSYNGGVESIVFGIQRTWLGSRLCYFNSCMTLENLLHFVGRQFSYIYGFSNYKKKKISEDSTKSPWSGHGWHSVTLPAEDSVTRVQSFPPRAFPESLPCATSWLNTTWTLSAESLFFNGGAVSIVQIHTAEVSGSQ